MSMPRLMTLLCLIVMVAAPDSADAGRWWKRRCWRKSERSYEYSPMRDSYTDGADGDGGLRSGERGAEGARETPPSTGADGGNVGGADEEFAELLARRLADVGIDVVVQLLRRRLDLSAPAEDPTLDGSLPPERRRRIEEIERKIRELHARVVGGATSPEVNPETLGKVYEILDAHSSQLQSHDEKLAKYGDELNQLRESVEKSHRDVMEQFKELRKLMEGQPGEGEGGDADGGDGAADAGETDAGS